jgi:hypothetical protein
MRWLLAGGLWVGLVLPLEAGGLKDALEVLRRAGPEAKGSKEASQAWKVVARADPQQLPEILAGMDGAGSVTRNWLRSAIEAVLQRAQEEKKELPIAALEMFLQEKKHDGQARRLAYELILEKDRTAADRFLPKMLDDPSPELRREAVARVLGEAEALLKAEKKGEALPLFRKALAAAREVAQVNQTAKKLRELGEQVDLNTHLGLILDWKLLGPFPNPEQKGMDTVYPPEKKLDLGAEYEGKEGKKIRWTDYLSKDALGLIDLNAGVGKHTDAVAFARTEFTSKSDQDVEIRIGCYTAFKLWVNGEAVLDRRDAYAGSAMDHYKVKVHLKKGKNVFLLKVCQEDPVKLGVAQLWQFRFRVCDPSGAAVLSATRSPTKP